MKLLVRFLRAKRYPHPDGPRRPAGSTHPIDAGLAKRWAKSGLVEFIAPDPALQSAFDALTVAELRELAADAGIDLTGAKRKPDIIAAITAAGAPAPASVADSGDGDSPEQTTGADDGEPNAANPDSSIQADDGDGEQTPNNEE